MLAKVPFQLKSYQKNCLDDLQTYLEASQHKGTDTAFYEQTKRSYAQIPELPDLPYVCLRLPTGGGKTVMAAKSVEIVADSWLHHDFPLVIWLTPSDTIRSQTLAALKNRIHPYRKVINERFGENVVVMDINEALYAPRDSFYDNACIIVSTIQAIRVDETEGRKVYQADGALMDHFNGLAEKQLIGLETLEDGEIVPSLANAIRVQCPYIIVDEAHGARTRLSFETLARFNPSMILELTATPQSKEEKKNRIKDGVKITDIIYPSNVLSHVSAAELKAEEMIKLPIILRGQSDWKEVIGDAKAQLAKLEELAQLEEKNTGEYIRPVMLLQAQGKYKNKVTITVEEVKKCLLEDFNIPENQIAIATGEKKEIEGVDLLARDCPVRYIITVKALMEGWDCSFAYVLCSVANSVSATAVEQILGRIMRLPHAQRKQCEDLNQAYAFATTTNFQETAALLADGLVKNGFEKLEAQTLIHYQPHLEGMEEGGAAFVFDESLTDDAPSFTPEVANKLEHSISELTGGRVSFKAEESTFTARGALSEKDKTSILLSIPDTAKAVVKSTLDKLALKSRHINPTPLEIGKIKPVFKVPCLAVRTGDMLERLDKGHFLQIPWPLEECKVDALLTYYNQDKHHVDEAHLNVTTDGKLVQKFINNVHDQLSLHMEEAGWTENRLVNWLNRGLHHREEITPWSAHEFIKKAFALLKKEKSLTLAQIARDKFRLVLILSKMIQELRAEREQKAFDNSLFGDSLPIEVSDDCALTFDEAHYAYNQPYKGRTIFKKHYFDLIGAFDGKEGGEEEQCATYIDNHPQVKYWIRNTERQKHSFSLRLARNKFYPDFICQLNDGRNLIVEYKGAHLVNSPDSQMKERVGQLWADKSKGKCLFAMPTNKDFSVIDNVIESGGDWPEGFFDETFGSAPDFPDRAPQPDITKREDM